MEHLGHRHANSVLIGGLLTILAQTIERLYRLRYLYRGIYRPAIAIESARLLRFRLCARHTPCHQLTPDPATACTQLAAPGHRPPAALSAPPCRRPAEWAPWPSGTIAPHRTTL